MEFHGFLVGFDDEFYLDLPSGTLEKMKNHPKKALKTRILKKPGILYLLHGACMAL